MKNLKVYMAAFVYVLSASAQAGEGDIRGKINEQAYLQTMERCESIKPGYTLSVVEGAGAATLYVGAFFAFVLKDGVSMTGSGGYSKMPSSSVSAAVSAVAATALAVRSGYRLIKTHDINETKRLISDIFTHGENGLAVVNLQAECVGKLGQNCNFKAALESLVNAINVGNICRADSKDYIFNIETGKFQ